MPSVTSVLKTICHAEDYQPTTPPYASTAKKPTRTNAAASCSAASTTTVLASSPRSRGAGNTRTDSPQNRYHIDPKELIRIQREGRERDEDIIGFYHSHPDHPAQWSQTDLAEAHWFGCSYVITSVAKGKADVTNSFELTGTDEPDKVFVDEKIEVS